MLLFSFANWDEILQICKGLCDDHEGIQNDNLHRPGGIPGYPGERTAPVTNEPRETLERLHQHDVA